MVICDEPLLWVVSTASEWSLSKTASQPAPSLVPHFHAPALASSVQLYGPASRVAWFVHWASCIFPGFLPSAFFRPFAAFWATRLLAFSGANSKEKARTSWQNTNPLDLHLHLLFFFFLCSLSLSLSLSVCQLCLVYSIQKCLRCCLRLSGQFFRVSELWGFIVIYCAIWFCHLRTPLAWGTLLQPVVLHSNNYNVAWRLCHFSWVCQPSLASENCPVGSPSEILLKLQGFCICSSGHKEHIASNALVLHAKRCLQAVLEKAVGSVAEDALWFVPCYFMRSRSSISK